MGSKARICKDIAPIINKIIVDNGITTYIEPFVGGANMIQHIQCKRKFGYDNNEYLIAFWQRIQQGWNPLNDIEMSKSFYQQVKDHKETYEPEVVALAGFCATYNAKWFGGYAGTVKTKIGTERNYYDEAVRNVLKQKEFIMDVRFCCTDYRRIKPDLCDALIYCDPPYQDTTGYKDDFDHEEYWEWVRKMSENNIVLCSEYSAPPDFECIWSKELTTTLDKNSRSKSVEKLFVYNKEKEKKEMELKINEMQLPAPISFNYEELKQEIESKVSMYTNLVYTDEQIQEAKKDKANLNKLKKALNDERIRMEKEYLVPFNAFKAQVNEIIGIIDKPVLLIDKQVKEYEEKQKRDKKDGIENFFGSCLHPEWLKFEQIFNEKWLNASVSMKSIQVEIDSRLERVANDIATLQNLPEFGFEAMEVYKTTLDLNKALNEGRRLSEIAKAKAAHEAEMKARAEEQARLEAEKARVLAEAEEKTREAVQNLADAARATGTAIAEGVKALVKEPAKQWVTFAAHLTTEDALALKAFFEERNIEFKAV